jgi:hypothetical protein
MPARPAVKAETDYARRLLECLSPGQRGENAAETKGGKNDESNVGAFHELRVILGYYLHPANIDGE